MKLLNKFLKIASLSFIIIFIILMIIDKANVEIKCK